MINLVMLFIIYGFLGWIVEVCFVRIGTGHWYNRGFLFMPFLPIYATGAILITLALERFSNVFVVYILGVLFTSALEYITSFLMERLFHTRWWDYSHYKYNLNGRVCLLNSLLFGLLAVVVIFVFNPFFTAEIDQLPLLTKNIIVEVWAAVFIVDLTYTLRNVRAMPVRDIRIISGKVKAYSNGKLRTLEEFLNELEDYRNNDQSIREDFVDYTKKLSEKHDIHYLVLATLAIVFIIGYLINNIFALELVTVGLVIIIALYNYNRKKH